MTLNLDLTPEIQLYLHQKAVEQGVSLEDYTLKLVTDTILEQQKRAKLVDLLQSWLDEEDEQEDQETGNYLINVLDQDRLSNRPLLPAKLKGISW